MRRLTHDRYPAMSDERIINATRMWVDTVVVDLNLCPFAKRELAADRVRFAVTAATDEDQLLRALQDELARLDADPAVATTLLIHPLALTGFDAYNAFLDDADALLVALDRDGVYQFASFHPDYQFSGTQADDPENYTNRSPYPMLHLLREDSLDRAIDSHPEVDQIPDRNVQLMRRMGRDSLQSLRAACLVSSADDGSD